MSELALPEGWAEALFTDCIEILDNQRKPINNTERQSRILGKDESELYPYYGATGQAGWIDGYLFNEELIALGEDGVPFLDISKHKAYMLRGKTWVNNHAHVLKAVEGVALNKYLLHFFNSIDYLGYVNGGTRLKLTQINMKKIPVILPSLNEQKEIVILLNTHLTTVSQIQARLDAIPKLIERFRQSVLNDAANGQLTQDWRRNNKISDWEWLEWYEITTKDKGAFKRGPFGSSLTKSMFVESGYKVYEQYCPINDDCSYARYYITPEKFEEMQQFEVLAGDLLISCSGVSLGRITKVPEIYEKGIINQALLRVRLNHDIYNSDFFIMLFRSPLFQEIIFNNSTGSAIPNLKATKLLKQIPVPNVSLAEQEEIVKRVQMFFEYANQIDKSLTIAKARVDHLTQSILHQAFTGNLTAEWREKNPELISGDNSAEALLAKIKSEKQGSGKKKSSKG